MTAMPALRRSNPVWLRRLSVTLALAAGMVVFASSAWPQAKPPASRDELVRQIQSYADGDVAGGAPLNDKEVIELFQNNQSGLTALDISNIYRQRYLDDVDKKKPFWDRVPRWLYGIAVVLAIFWRPLKNAIEEALKRSYETLFARYAGAKLFRGRALRRYRACIDKLHSELKIPFRETPLPMREVYVPLRVSERGSVAPTDAVQAIRSYRRLVVKGVPGSGKSMLLRWLLLAYADGRLSGIEHDPVPVLVDLSRLNDPDTTLLKQVIEAFGRYGFPHAESFVTWALEHDGLLLLLDGLDEVNAKLNPDTNTSRRSIVVQEIKDLAATAGCRYVVTCRTQVYRDEFATTADRTLEVAEFADSDIFRFLNPWTPNMTEGQSVEHLMQTLRDRPRILALARNPLLLTMIAYLYADQHRALPHSRAEFYAYSTDVLLDKWQGAFNRFGKPAKSAVLSKLALLFQAQPAEDQDRRSLPSSEVLKLVREVLPGTTVKLENAGDFLDEIVDRSGLLLRIDGGTRFQFDHLTMQEYFAAAALSDNRLGLLANFHSDRDTWREVVKLWCGQASDATQMIGDLAKTELVTAMECLADAKYVKTEVADEIVEQAKQLLTPRHTSAAEVAAAMVRSESDPTGIRALDFSIKALESVSVGKALGLLASVPGPRGAAMLAWLSKQLIGGNIDTQLAAAFALASSNLEEAANRLLARSSPEALVALESMGDVAARPLLKAKKAALLVKIGTPTALEAAVSLLWDEQACLEAAAKLAQRLAEPAIEAMLRDVRAPALGSAGEYRWVWEPFQEPPTSSLPRIAARIVYVLDTHSEDLVSVVPGDGAFTDDVRLYELGTIDPRIALPLYICVGDRVTLDPAQPWLTVPSLREIFMKALPEELQPELQQRIEKLRPPERDDWLRIFQPTVFEFEKSRHMLFLKLLCSGVLLAWIYCLYATHVLQPPLFAWWKLLVVLAAIPIFSFATTYFFHSGGDPVLGVPALAVFGLPVWQRAVHHRQWLKNRMQWVGFVAVGSPLVLCAPLVIYFCSLELHKFLAWPLIAALWVVLYAVGGVVWWLGRRKERMAKNPLQGLIPPPKGVAPEPSAHSASFTPTPASRAAFSSDDI